MQPKCMQPCRMLRSVCFAARDEARDSDEDHAYSIADAPHGYPRAELVVAYFASSWQGGPVHKHFLCGDDADESEKLRNAILSEVEAAE